MLGERVGVVRDLLGVVVGIVRPPPPQPKD